MNFDPRTTKLGSSLGHVFEYISLGLPMAAKIDGAMELDHAAELPSMVEWVHSLEPTVPHTC
jgi:hypothetical protein